jgi:hypothetical protein
MKCDFGNGVKLMKRISKNLFSVFMALAMVITIVPFSPARAYSAAPEVQNNYVAGDIISFGFYPQTKVTNAALITALNGSTLSADNTVIYGGDKYQRVCFTQYTPHYLDLAATAENSNQDNNGYFINTVYWFKFDPIQWRVLSYTDGVLFILADKILDSRVYNQTFSSVTWETSAARSWLNNEFYNKAFTMNEKIKIKSSDLVNENNPWEGTSGGNNTSDRLFLLSYAESINTAYGFDAVYETNDTARRVQGTDYSKSSGLLVSANVPYTGNSDWWLRSPGANSFYAGYVSKSGSSKNYIGVINTDLGIRPACRIQLATATYSTGDILEFGSYPQSAVTDSNLITSLNACTLSADNTVIYNGKKYKKVLFAQYSSISGGYTDNSGYTYQDNNGYYKNTVYWFKCEPIRWRVLSNNNGNLFVFAEKILDSLAYNPSNASITWEACAARSWLNNEFNNAAFSAEEKALIKTSNVINSNNPVSGVTGGNNTADRLFLLSYAEAVNTAYGFSAAVSADTARTAQGTDFSRCSGLYVNTGTPNINNSYWWLRSPGNSSSEAMTVAVNGSVSSDINNQACLGIRPALKLNIQSAALISAENSTCAVDSENKFIYGLTPGLTSLTGYAEGINGFILSYSGTLGTGSRVNVSTGGWVVDSYKTVIFGDINGDSSIDSMDAGIAVDVENYIVSWSPAADACLYLAGDVNGDGEVDSIDAGIMVDAENYLVTIDQTGTA